MGYNDVSGEIYFIGEVNRLTKEASEFVKIGLVREKEGRGSADRLDEHQTGNPRELALIEVVATPFVDAAESMLHSFFAPRRVRGEWFKLPGDEVKEAIAKARAVAEELAPYRELFTGAEAVAKQLATEEVIVATDEVVGWHKRLLEAKARNKFVESFADLIKEEVVQAEARGMDTSGVMQTQVRKGTERFDEEGFAKAHPDLFAQFSVVDVKFKGNFTVKDVRSLPEVKDFDPELFELGEQINKVAEDFRAGSVSLGVLTDKKLELDQKSAMFELDEEVFAARIKIACGTAAGIDGVCTWKRVAEEKTSFKKAKFKEEYPDIYAKFVTIGEPTEAKSLKKQVAAE